MKIQILVDGAVVNTQLVSETLFAVPPTLRDAKRIALRAALEDRAILPSHALRARFLIFDSLGKPIDDVDA